jgi:RimJ/RimL family protein N-acetyltransferase
VIDNAFDVMRLNRLMARVQSGNHPARRLLESLGFQEEERLPDIVRGGDIRACTRYGLGRPVTG